MANELDDLLRRYSDTETPAQGVSFKQKNLEALQRAAEQARVNELANLQLSPEDLKNYATNKNSLTPASTLDDLKLAKQYDAMEAFKSSMSDEAIPQGKPYGGVDNRLVGSSYGEINPRSPKADINEKRLAEHFQHTLPEFNTPIEKFPAQADDIDSLLSKYATGSEIAAPIKAPDIVSQKENMLARQIPEMKLGEIVKNETQQSIIPKSPIGPESVKSIDLNPNALPEFNNSIEKFPTSQKEIYLNNKFTKQATPYKQQFKVPEMDLGEVVKNEAQQNIVPDSLVGTESIDDLSKGMSKALLKNKIKNIVTNPKLLAAAAGGVIDMGVNVLGSSSGNVGAFDVNTTGPREGTVYDDLEKGKRASMDLGAMPDPKILNLFSKYSNVPFDDDRSNLGPLDKSQAVISKSEEDKTKKTEPKISTAQSKEIQANPAKAKEKAVAKIDEANRKLSEQDISAKEYEDAIKQRNMNQFIATMAQAAERIGYSMAGANAQVLKPDLSFTNKMMEQAGQPLIDLKERRKEREEQESNDPNSEKSKQFQDILISMHPELESKIRKMPYSNLEKEFPSIMNALNVREGIKARKESAALQRAALEMKQDESRLDKHNTAITNDLIKLNDEHSKDTASIETAISLANEAKLNPQAATNIVRSIVKAVEGGPSRVSDKDITTALGARGVSEELQTWFKKKMQGTMPKAQADDVIAMLYVMKDLREKDHEARRNQVLELRARGQNRDIEKVKEQFIPGYGLNKEKELSKKSESSSTKGQDWRYKGP